MNNSTNKHFSLAPLNPSIMKSSNKGRSILLLILVGIALLTDSGHARKQGDALGKLYKAKFTTGDLRIDTSPFDVSEEADLPQSLPEIEVTSQHAGKKQKDKDKIWRLPGQPRVGFSQYGGYVTIDEKAGRAFYYYFVEAEKDKHSKPLLLWLNGGPGCSSLGYGALQELGPFRVHSDGKTLFRNRFSWNQNANVLFLESPAGVGFSYSNKTSDFVSGGDRKTALDNHAFLLNWLERFPEYKDREVYLSGESYAGHYVPQLAHTILRFNKKAKKTLINLQGIIIGNAAINDETDSIGMYDYFASHALNSPETLRRIHRFCDFSPNGNNTEACHQAINEAEEVYNDIDVYNIYAPRCANSDLTRNPKITDSDLVIDPCSEYYVYAYLNHPRVQKALHANVTKISYDWEPCSDVLKTWNDSPSTVLPLLREFMENGLRVWIFSGDTDGRVPVTSTLYAIGALKLPVKTPWRSWVVNDEVGGYTQVYEGDITFATVRGAGHQVPSYQPARALTLINYFLAGLPLPPQLV